MLLQLDIKNYAIIDQVSIDFSDGLNIITGETGSGKSILLGALGLILGDRADAKALLQKDRKCIIEATFSIDDYDLRTFFDFEDLDYLDPVLIRREINPAGKSRAFINDTPVTLKQLQSLTSQLVDLHGQFENLGINENKYQIMMLDALAGNQKVFADYREQFGVYLSLTGKLEKLRKTFAESIKQRDYLQFQLTELLECNLDPESDAGLEEKLTTLENAEEIIQVMGSVATALEADESSLISKTIEIKSLMATLRSYHFGAGELTDRLHAIIVEMQDIASEASQISEEVELDPEKISELRERIDLLNHLFHKHQVNDLASLEQIRDDIDDQIQSYDNTEEEIEGLEKQIRTARENLKSISRTLSENRKAAIPAFEKNVNHQLKNLRMEHATFKVDLVPTSELNKYGMDQLAFLFAPNKGSNFSAIKDVASGGEISRLSLITKSLVAGSLHMPTLIFDEIDSGVSGDVAQKMGHILKSLSSKHQIISITHSPQVAARASKHFRVHKEIKDGNTIAVVSILKEKERIVEIATMLSSSPPSKAAMTSARELIIEE